MGLIWSQIGARGKVCGPGTGVTAALTHASRVGRPVLPERAPAAVLPERAPAAVLPEMAPAAARGRQKCSSRVGSPCDQTHGLESRQNRADTRHERRAEDNSALLRLLGDGTNHPQ